MSVKVAVTKKAPSSGPYRKKSPRSTRVAEQDYAYRNDMINRYLHLVKIIVHKMRPKLPMHADLDELQSAGVLGLLAAIDKFDAKRGYTFETYASIRIRGAVLDEMRKMDWLPRSLRKHIKTLKSTTDQMEQDLGREPTEKELCKKLGMSTKQYKRIQSDGSMRTVICLDAKVTEEGNLHDIIADESAEPIQDLMEREELLVLVAQHLEQLPYRERKIMQLYYYKGMRMVEIAECLGISEARVSQIRTQALVDLRKFVKKLEESQVSQ